MKRALASALFLAALCALAACTDESVSDATFAIDTDGNGTLDCADLDHVLVCVHHPGASECAHADVNGDGVVDAADVHAVTQAILETGHHCDGHHNVDHVGYHDGEHTGDGPDPHHEDTVVDHHDAHHTGDDPHHP